MYLLAEILPVIKKLRIPFSRDQAVMFLTALMLVLVGVDIYLAHDLDAVIKPKEWIPILFSPLAGIALFACGWVSLKHRLPANIIASCIMGISVIIGVLGSYYHLHWTILPDAPAGQQITTTLLIYGPPLLGPLTFILIAFMGMSAIWVERPVDSGNLSLWNGKSIRMPTSKTQAYFLITGIFILATVLSSVLDHSRTQFQNPWLWLPTLAGVFAVICCVGAGMLPRLNRVDLWVYFVAMLLMILVGIIGFVLHIERNLVHENTVILERFLRGAPFMAPLLFSNMGLLGLLVMLEPKEK
jgi:hypothetical protein